MVPVTSSPLITYILGRNPVSPLALIPLAILVIVWLIPYIIRGGRFPTLILPLLTFALIALISNLRAWFLPIFPLLDQGIGYRSLRALATLAIGVSLYLTAVTIMPTEEKRRASLKALYLGGMLLLFWSTLQVVFVLEPSSKVPLRMNNIHHFISIRDMIYNRVTGFAYEPSWLGNQMIILYLPLWFSSMVTGASVYKARLRFLPFEALLFTWGLIVFFFTQSRISYMSFLFMVGLILIGIGWALSGRIVQWFWRDKGETRRILQSGLRVGILLLSVMILISLVYVTALGMRNYDERMRNMFKMPAQWSLFEEFYLDEAGLELANRLAFAERIVYWIVGYRSFETYPIFGVGLGNTGFFFERFLPAYAYRLTEVRGVLDPLEPFLPNPKNLWIRLLGETGVVGFTIYLVWYFWLGYASWRLFRMTQDLDRMVGLAGLLSLAAGIIEGFNLDSFALPQVWILPGLVTAAYWTFGGKSDTDLEVTS